jgi:hypothetical protein
MNTDKPLVVAYGGGTNSVAMLCGFRERNIKPDLLIFADTGGELPHTYNHIDLMSKKCEEWWGIPIERVYAKYKGEYESLEDSCIRKKTLPSLAFGFKACSMKHKVEPQNKRVREWMKSNGVSEIVRAIGYDAAEGHRKVNAKDAVLAKGLNENYWYPLIEWMWTRRECIEVINRNGIPLPGKSSCFFCPAMKNGEILRLKRDYPEYFERAIAMEKNLDVSGRVKGLAFGIPWSEIVEADENQLKLFEWLDENDPHKIPCGCYDG